MYCLKILPTNNYYLMIITRPLVLFFFIRCPMNKKIILVWPYYVNYDIGIHEIWQPFMKLYKCIYPSTSSPLENVQVKIHISTTVVISVINFQLFWTVRSKFSAYSCACLFPIESSLLTSKMNLLALLQKSKVLFSKPFLTHSRRLSIINNYICHWSQKERKLSHLELNHGKLSIQNEKEMLMNVKKWMYR